MKKYGVVLLIFGISLLGPDVFDGGLIETAKADQQIPTLPDIHIDLEGQRTNGHWETFTGLGGTVDQRCMPMGSECAITTYNNDL